MKDLVFHLMNTFLLSASLITVSCGKQPDTETIRLYLRAEEAFKQGRYGEVTELLYEQNRFPPALVLRAKADFFSGEIEKAEKSCRRAIKLQPSSSEANLYLARILREKGDLAGAFNTAEKLLADNPQDIRTLRFAAGLAMETEKLDEAAILLDKAAGYSGESALVLLDRARLRWITGRKDDALEDLSRAAAMLPWDSPLSRSINNLEKTIREAQ